MREAVLPLIGYCLLQFFTAVVGLNVQREKEIGASDLLKSWIFGQMLLFAVLQIMAVPMILVKWKFNTLFWSYVIVCLILFGFGCWRLKETKIRLNVNKTQWNWFAVILLIAALALILFQSGQYLFRMHLDEDDARWLAEANDALEYGDMMIRDYDTGDYVGHIQVPKDTTSPWPMMIAIVSRILGIKTAVFAHTIYAPIELLLMYGIYWLIGTELFEKLEARLTFLLSVAAINLFFGMTVYTQATFSQVRIWQGKATVAGVIIPLLLYLFLRIHRSDGTSTWWMVLITCCAGCLMSGMGISLSAMLILAYGACFVVLRKKWDRIPLLVISVLPSGVFLFIYSLFKTLY